ncbi:MAG: UDP-N-acetylmuramoyl-tripeptide--D-alanyl-D-alanine ligase [Dictyoglomaceae bacterium]|nr:UDP-N-acetylmuramoyl-tripeptide--D-alanyl-D-alanine ligase [Dictyoglomaceae bacterium]
MKLKLREVLEAVNGELVKGNLDVEILSISTDSRRIKEGDLFIPLLGEKYDGHDFIYLAIKKGARGIFFSKEIDLDILKDNNFAIKVKDTLKALQDLASYYREKKRFKVIGITGSSGKTSTKYFTVDIFKGLIPLHFSKENFNNEIGVPLSILEADEKSKLLILELAMRGLGEIRILSKIAKPDYALITNIGTAHIGRLGSQENIAKAKAEIFEYLKPDGWAILNGDDFWCNKIYHSLPSSIQKIRYGFQEENDVKGKVNYLENMARIEVSFLNEKRISFDISPYPLEIYQNLLGSLTLLFLIFPNFSEEFIEEKINNLSLPYQRLNIKKGRMGIFIIDDTYNANPDSMIVAINFLKLLNKGERKIAILGDMLELGDYSFEFHKKIVEFGIKSGLDMIFIFGEEMGKVYPFLKSLYPKYPLFYSEDFDLLLEIILEKINTQDLILVKGSRGMQMERFVEKLEVGNG